MDNFSIAKDNKSIELMRNNDTNKFVNVQDAFKPDDYYYFQRKLLIFFFI